MKLGKYRQHSLLTAADQITSKPQRMFLQREPLLPYWAPMKALAKIQLTLLPSCKEPDCITLLAALSIPEEVFLSRVQEQSPPRAAGSGLQLGNLVCNSWLGWWPEDPLRAAGASPPPATSAAPAVHVSVGGAMGVSTSLPVCSWLRPRAGEHLLQMLPTTLSSRLHNIRGTALLGVQDPGHLHPPSALPESTGADARVHALLTFFSREEKFASHR